MTTASEVEPTATDETVVLLGITGNEVDGVTTASEVELVITNEVAIVLLGTATGDVGGGVSPTF